ncbi:MAG: response regulator transcription factor [Paludibacteraceae bacterium]|nr:response regulator transcription factor [Paludibacteraceae bacterium]
MPNSTPIIPQHILVAQADDTLRVLIAEYLAEHGFCIHEAQDGKQLTQVIEHVGIDLILTDSNLPFLSAVQLLDTLRALGNTTPVFVVSSNNSKEEIIKTYKAGADDYILKPFSIDILTYRIRALLHRLELHNKSLMTEFEFADCRYDSNRLTISSAGRSVTLTPRENEIMLMLARNLGNIVDRQQILLSIWRSSDIFASKSLNVYMTNLRHHIEPFTSLRLITIPAKGYKLTIN